MGAALGAGLAGYRILCPMGVLKRIHRTVVKPSVEAVLRAVALRVVERAKVDPRITYPCYKSFDEFIDVERLKSLDGYIKEGIARHVRAEKDQPFNTGALTLRLFSPKKPGSRVIHLTQSKRPFRYQDLDKPDLWQRTKEADEFSRLMDFVSTFPFKRTARIMILYDDSGKPVTPHRDHISVNVCHEFIWFRTNLEKPFYMLNHRTNEKRYVESYSAWFDSVNQFHGSEARDGLSFSLRVDGLFSDEFRARIPTPAYNLASSSALWACTSGASAKPRS